MRSTINGVRKATRSDSSLLLSAERMISKFRGMQSASLKLLERRRSRVSHLYILVYGVGAEIANIRKSDINNESLLKDYHLDVYMERRSCSETIQDWLNSLT